MKFRNAISGLLVLALLDGCSSVADKKKVDYKNGAAQVAPLEVPPEFTTPELDQRYAIPGGDGGMVASYSEYNKQKTEQPCVPPANALPVAISAPTPSAKLLDSNDTKHILLTEPFDRSWRKVGLALERARVLVTDKDRSKGIYYVVPASNKKTGRDKKKQPDYQVTVRESGEGSDVTVTDQSGKSDADTTRLVEVLFANLNSENNPAGNPPSGDRGAQPPR